MTTSYIGSAGNEKTQETCTQCQIRGNGAPGGCRRARAAQCVCDMRLKHGHMTLKNIKSHHINSKDQFLLSGDDVSVRWYVMPLRVPFKHLLHWITFCLFLFRISPSFIFHQSSLHRETQFSPPPPIHTHILYFALFTAAQWTDLQAP